jgi:hypothetical protein
VGANSVRAGWFGVLALAVAVAHRSRGWRAGWREAISLPRRFLPRSSGFLLVGLTESLFDGPRVTTMFFLLLFTGLLQPCPTQERVGGDG